MSSHPGVEVRANLKSISHRYYLFELDFLWELNKETIHLPLGCLQGGQGRTWASAAGVPVRHAASLLAARALGFAEALGALLFALTVGAFVRGTPNIFSGAVGALAIGAIHLVEAPGAVGLALTRGGQTGYEERRHRDRDNRLRTLGGTRPHTVGYLGGCDQDQGEIESPCRLQHAV